MALYTNCDSGYGRVSQVIHWMTAAIMFGLVGLGLYSKGLGDGETRDVVLMIHKSLGMVVIVLTLIRLAWMVYSPAPPDRAKLKTWEVHAARTGHVLLYAILLAMPLSGVMMSMGSGREVGFFNLFSLPQLLPLDPGLPPRQQHYYKLGKDLHDNAFQWSLYFIFALHIAGVVKHQFIDRDAGFIRRMWGSRSGGDSRRGVDRRVRGIS